MKLLTFFLLLALAGCAAPDPSTAYERSLVHPKPSLYQFTLPPKAI